MNRIKIVSVGCAGGRGLWFTGELARHDDFELVALVDEIPEAAKVIAENLNISDKPIFQDTAEALSKIDCDAVVVSTPDALHRDSAVAALGVGKHVFVEKPLSVNLEDCLDIVKADEAAGHKTMVGFNLRFAPLYEQANQLVRSGAVGRVLTIQADEFYEGGRTYFRRWNRLRSMGGGLWITKASHDFDLLYWMAGELPKRVSAFARLTHYVPKPEAGARCSQCPIEVDCPDSAIKDMGVLESPWKETARDLFAVREKVGWYPDLCLFNSDKETFDHGIAQVEFEKDIIGTYTCNVVASLTDRRMRISGSDGMLEGRLESNEMMRYRRHTPVDGKENPQVIRLVECESLNGHGGGDQHLLSDFARFVRGEPARALNPVQASVAIAIGLAATMSSDSNKTVEMDEVPGWNELKGYLARQ